MKFAVELDEQLSAKTLDRAIRTQAQILVELSGESPGSYCGQLVSGDDMVVLAELTRALPADRTALAGRYVDVQVFSDQRYLFTSHIVADGGRLEATTVALNRPVTLQVMQRRRFWRARLAPSSAVQLTFLNHADATVGEATMLNLSADGLACRLPEAFAGAIRAGESVEVKFELSDITEPFTFNATIKNKTLGSGSSLIVGLQFETPEDDDDALAMLNRLRDGLYQRETELLTEEVLR